MMERIPERLLAEITTMEERMEAKIVAEMKTNQERLEGKMDANKEKMDAWLNEVKAWRKERAAYREVMEVSLESKEPTPVEMKSVAVNKEVPRWTLSQHWRTDMGIGP
jgi:hypothetical protein